MLQVSGLTQPPATALGKLMEFSLSLSLLSALNICIQTMLLSSGGPQVPRLALHLNTAMMMRG